MEDGQLTMEVGDSSMGVADAEGLTGGGADAVALGDTVGVAEGALASWEGQPQLTRSAAAAQIRSRRIR